MPVIWWHILIFVAATLVGLLMGFYVLVAASGPPIAAALLGVIVVAPFGLIIACRLFGDLRTLLMAAMLLDLCVAVNIHLFYQPLVVMVSALAGLTVSVAGLSLVALYGLWILDFLTGRTTFPIRALLSTAKPLAVYVAASIFSLIVAQSWLLASFELNVLVQGLLTYILIVHTIKTRRAVLLVVTALVIGLALQGALMVMLKATGGYLDIGILTAQPDPWGRLSGTVGASNQTASFLVMWLALTLGMMLTPAPFLLKVIGVGATLLGLVGLFLTLSRGGWIAYAIVLVIVGFIGLRRGWIPLYVPIGVGLLAIAVLVPLWPYIMARLFGPDNGSAEARLPLMRMALSIIRDHPILGVGSNNYITMLPEYVDAEYTNTWIRVVHNKFLLVWAETGILGLSAFIWFLLDTLVRGVRVVRANDRYLSPLALGLTAAILGWLFHMQVALFNDDIQVLTLCLASSLIAVMDQILKNNKGTGNESSSNRI